MPFLTLRQTKWGFSFDCTRQRHSKPSIVPFRSAKRIPFLHFEHSYLEEINPSFITQLKTAVFPCSQAKQKNPVVASLSSNFISQAILTTGGKSSQKSEHVGKKVRAGVNSTCCSRVKIFLLDRFKGCHTLATELDNPEGLPYCKLYRQNFGAKDFVAKQCA
ncbi:hypothetical protein TNCV_1788781 [Trichonephila clavipes]|nr:hypothetical protein TNCV_1788781 [Trichonephila clavipes]